MSIYNLRKGGAYGRAIGMLVSGPQYAKKRYWGSPSKSSFKTSAFGRQVISGKLKSTERGLKKEKVKGGYIVEDYCIWPSMVNALNDLLIKENAVQIGLFAETSSEDVVSIGAKNEFGSGVPQRSFIGLTFDQRRKELQDRFNSAKIPLLLGRMKPRAFFEKEGENFKKNIVDFINGNFWLSNKPNALSTIRKKGFNHPLIESGEMLSSIDYKVVRGEA